MSNVYKLKGSLVWVLILDAGSRVHVDLSVDYSVIQTIPELRSFAQSGPLDIIGPQQAILIIPNTILPPEILDTIILRQNLGAYRELISSMPAGDTSLTTVDLITLIGIAIIKSDEYEAKIT
jgi:hypothetical protein